MARTSVMNDMKLRAIARRKMQRRRNYENTLPYLGNFMDLTTRDIERKGLDLENDFVAEVINLLDDNGTKTTSMISVKGKISKELVTQIVCPICGKPVKINEHWNCFICQNGHEKMIFDIQDIKRKHV